jgi:high-affinity iron transporter
VGAIGAHLRVPGEDCREDEREDCVARPGRPVRAQRREGLGAAARGAVRSFRGRIAIAVCLCLLAGAVGGIVASGSAGGGGDGRIVVSGTACAPGWVAPRSGRTVFTVENTSTDAIYGVDLVGANQISVYGEIEMLAPGTADTMDVVLPPGSYSFQCESFAGFTINSRVERVDGPAVGGAHPYMQVNADQIQIATLAYRSSLMAVMRRLERDTDALRRAVDAGTLGAARALWLPAHLDYERLGAAYDTFGNFDSEINGRPLGLVGGVRNPRFRGFLRLEYGLWHRQSPAELVPVAAALDAAVRGLVKRFPQMLTPANDLSLRTHEILENTLQFELTGETDEGSDTNLATAWANVQGTELALDALRPLLRAGDPSLLATLTRGLAGLATAFESYRRSDGTWAPLASLTPPERERLDGETGALLEQLSKVPDVLELPIRPSDD